MSLTRNSAVEFDIESELLIAELTLNDIAAVQSTRKGKARENAPRSDEDIAFDLQAMSLHALADVLHDHQFALSIDRAIESDTRQLRRCLLINQAERDDHCAAVALEGGHDLPQQTISQQMMERTSVQANREHREPATTFHVSTIVGPRATQNVPVSAMPSGSASALPTKANVGERRECVICRDYIEKSSSFKAPCGHRYCRGCLVNLVETSLRDEGLHPLRCCHRQLPLTSGVFTFISASLQCRFMDKAQEFSVPVGSRMYCSNPRCSAFLGTSGVTRTTNYTCYDCGTISCSQCKDNAHPGKGCAEHQLTAELRDMATANKWQTCPGCHAIVELGFGCYHITCRCSAQFCYLCGARWKTCSCQQWDEDRLLDDAERRVRNEFGNRAAEVQPAVHAERVHRRMEVLRENHECQAHLFRYRQGAGQCEECGDVLRIYLMRCIHCQTLVCRRCSVNRL